MSFIIIIPARYSSTRLPEKALLDINGKPMIAHVLNHAYESGADRVIVATDHEKVANIIEIMGGEVCMTSTNHESGTERLAEVVDKYGFSNDTVIVNLQVDEPMISATTIRRVVDSLIQHEVKMVTVATPFFKKEETFDPNVVKVILDINSYALYFFRIAVLQNYDFFKKFKNTINSDICLHHLGVYSYRADFIRRYVNWRSSPLEQIERLEQLRTLWYGEKIYVVKEKKIYFGVNTLEDLKHIRTILF